MNRSFKEFFLLLAIVAVASAAWVGMEPESEPRIAFEPGDLTIHGVKLGWTLKQIEKLHGKAHEVRPGMVGWGSSLEPFLRATFDGDGKADFLSGTSIEVDGSRRLSSGMPSKAWVEVFGRGQIERHRFTHCAFTPPTTVHVYKYSSLALTVTAESHGYFWQSKPKACHFSLSNRVLVRFEEFLGPIPYLPETEEPEPGSSQAPNPEPTSIDWAVLQAKTQ